MKKIFGMPLLISFQKSKNTNKTISIFGYIPKLNLFSLWLAVGGRKLRVNRFFSDSLTLSYLKSKLIRDIYQNFDKKPETLCFIQLLSFLDQRQDKIQILERSLGFIKIHFQAEDFFNFLGISLGKYNTRKLVKIMDIMHRQSSRLCFACDILVAKFIK